MRRKLTIMLVTAAVLVLIVATAASSMLPTYDNTLKAEERIYDRMGKAELLETMKTKFKEESDTESLIPITSIFHQRRDEYTGDELLALIEDNSLSPLLRVTFIQVLDDLSSFSRRDGRIAKLLEKDIPNDVKSSIIAHFGGEGGLGTDELVKQAYNEDRYISYQAIRRLGRANTEIACKVSRDILQNYKTSNVGQVKAALGVISGAHDPKLKMTEADIKLMYTVADYILHNDRLAEAKNTVVFSLRRTNTIEALEYIMHHEKIDNEILRKGTVIENWHVLVKALKNDPTEEEIALALECMELRPLTEVIESLEDAIESNPQLISANGKLTQKKVSDILEYAKKNAESITVLPDLAAKGGLIDE